MASQPVIIATSSSPSSNHLFAAHNSRAKKWLSDQSRAADDMWKKSVYSTGAAMIGRHDEETKDTKGPTYADEAEKIITFHTNRLTEQITRDEWEEWYKRTIKERYTNEKTAEDKRTPAQDLYGACIDAFSNTAEGSNADEVSVFTPRHGGEAFIIDVLSRDEKQRREYENRWVNLLQGTVVNHMDNDLERFSR